MKVDLPDWVVRIMRCPRDGAVLVAQDDAMTCASGHRYRIRDGIPIVLLDDIEHTHEAALHALRGEEEPAHFRPTPDGIDPFAQEAIAATGGFLYKDLVGKLTEYPIPQLRLPRGDGRTFLDIGCSWGRWSIAAARLGYRVLGIDPSLVGVRAARRIAKQLRVEASFLVADARHLPFAPRAFDTVFSYSVLQHFSKSDARRTLSEIGRVLSPGGQSMIQLPNAFGMRSLYHQVRRGGREPKLFEVRYWTVPELQRTFEKLIGPSNVTIDGFLSLNAQAAEAHVLSSRARAVVALSEWLRTAARLLPAMKYVADSLYITSRR